MYVMYIVMYIVIIVIFVVLQVDLQEIVSVYRILYRLHCAFFLKFCTYSLSVVYPVSLSHYDTCCCIRVKINDNLLYPLFVFYDGLDNIRTSF